MKDVLLLLGSNIQLSPYVQKYIKLIRADGCNPVLLYWDRGSVSDEESDNDYKVIRYTKKIDNDMFPLKKIPFFLSYRKKIETVLESRKWDLVIVFTTPLAILISDLLYKRYAGRYIIDYRDPTVLEKLWIFRHRLGKAIYYSCITAISSKAYGSYLPYKEKLLMNHNYSKGSFSAGENESKSDKIRIVFWGCVRDYEANIHFLQKLKNDERFTICYYGTYDNKGKKIKQYCEINHISNVIFYGKYKYEDRGEIAAQADLIHNVYSNTGKKGNPSMGNKFYDGILFKVPQICLKGGYMGKMVEQYHIGITIDWEGNYADRIYQYFRNLDRETFKKNCDRCLKDILDEEKRFETLINRILLEES